MEHYEVTIETGDIEMNPPKEKYAEDNINKNVDFKEKKISNSPKIPGNLNLIKNKLISKINELEHAECEELSNYIKYIKYKKTLNIDALFFNKENNDKIPEKENMNFNVNNSWPLDKEKNKIYLSPEHENFIKESMKNFIINSKK